MTNQTEVRQQVIAVLHTLVPRTYTVTEDSHLFHDLKLLSDDFTSMALRLEKRLKVWIPRDEWGPVQTVRDVINLLEWHAKPQSPNNKS